MPNLTSIAIIAILLGGIGTAGYFYFVDTQQTITQLRDQNNTLQIVAQQNAAEIDRMRADAAAAQQRMDQLYARARQAEQYQDQLISKLRRHNLTALTLKKPGLVEKRVNQAIADLAKDIEEYTSDQPVEDSDASITDQ